MEAVSTGRARIDLAASRMPVLEAARESVSQSGALRGKSVGVAVHITSETAVLVEALLGSGVEHVALCSSNWRTADPEICGALESVDAISIHGRTTSEEDFSEAFRSVLDTKPRYLIDDGAELIKLSHEVDTYRGFVRGALEETTSGVRRVTALANSGNLQFPVVAINNARTKHYFDNRYGTGQSAVDAVMRVSNTLFAGAAVAVIGYGKCGKGIARAAAGLGGHVMVAEIDPVAALQAHYDGFHVGKAIELCARADVVFTATGSWHVIGDDIWKSAQNGAIFANCGHFRNELDMASLETLHVEREIRPGLYRYESSGSGRALYVLSEGNIANLSVAEGNPATLIDMSFANQLLGLEWLAQLDVSLLEPRVLALPATIDDWVARKKLQTSGLDIDTVGAEQAAFARSLH